MPGKNKLRLELIPGPLWRQNLRCNVVGLGAGRWLKLSRVIFIARQFRSVPTETSPRYLSETSSAVRIFLSDIKSLLAWPTRRSHLESLSSSRSLSCTFDGAAALLLEGTDRSHRRNGYLWIDKGRDVNRSIRRRPWRMSGGAQARKALSPAYLKTYDREATARWSAR
jgi:hypothetical protein